MVASAVGMLAVVLAVRIFAVFGSPATPLLTLVMAALPIACLTARPTLVSMMGVVITGFPCFVSATMYCDIAPSSTTGGLLHATEGYLLFLPVYGFLRAIHLAVTKP
jgi:hypothetical protein